MTTRQNLIAQYGLNPITRELSDTLKELIFLNLSAIANNIKSKDDIDFTVYEVTGNFKAAPFHFNSDGIQILNDSQQPIKQYILNDVPAIITNDIFNYINPSQFIIEKHPFHEFNVKVEVSEHNHFEMLVFQSSVFILSVNQHDFVSESTFTSQENETFKRLSEIEQIWQQSRHGEIPHKLPSTYSQSIDLYKREEISEAPQWQILDTRALEPEELIALKNERYANPLILSLPLGFISFALIMKTSWLTTPIGFVLFFLALSLAYRSRKKMVIDEAIVIVKGMLKINPKIPFYGPIDAHISPAIDTHKIEQKQSYTFHVLKNTKKIIHIDGIESPKKRASRFKGWTCLGIHSFIMLAVCATFFFTLNAPYPNFEGNLIDKSLVYLDMLKKPEQPYTEINYTANSDYIPKVLDKIKLTGFAQCNNQTYIHLCDKLHLLPDRESGFKVNINPNDREFILPYASVNYFMALNRHYFDLPATNEILLDEDYTLSPVFTIIARNKMLFKSDDNYDMTDKVFRYDLTEEGFYYLANPMPISVMGIIKKVEFIETPHKRWVIHLSQDLNDEQINSSYQHFILLILQIILILILCVCLNRNLQSKIMLLISKKN